MNRAGRKSTKHCFPPSSHEKEKNQILVEKAEGKLGGQVEKKGRYFPPEKSFTV
jgi:hypothetical protein